MCVFYVLVYIYSYDNICMQSPISILSRPITLTWMDRSPDLASHVSYNRDCSPVSAPSIRSPGASSATTLGGFQATPPPVSPMDWTPSHKSGEQPPSPPDAYPAKLMLMGKKKCVPGQCRDSACTVMPAVAAAVAPVATPVAASVVAPIAVSVGPQEVQTLLGGVELMASSYGPSRVKVGTHLTRTFDSGLEARTFARMASAEIQKFSKMKRDRQTSYWANLQCVDRRFLRSSDTKDARMGFLHAALVNKQIPGWEVRYQAAVATARIQPAAAVPLSVPIPPPASAAGAAVAGAAVAAPATPTLAAVGAAIMGEGNDDGGDNAASSPKSDGLGEPADAPADRVTRSDEPHRPAPMPCQISTVTGQVANASSDGALSLPEGQADSVVTPTAVVATLAEAPSAPPTAANAAQTGTSDELPDGAYTTETVAISINHNAQCAVDRRHPEPAGTLMEADDESVHSITSLRQAPSLLGSHTPTGRSDDYNISIYQFSI